MKQCWGFFGQWVLFTRFDTPRAISGWNSQGFDDSSWLTGPGGIGYGDGDDMTVIDNVPSVNMRRDFTLHDISAISAFCLFVDFDDGFVACLNGHEIARANIGTVVGTNDGRLWLQGFICSPLERSPEGSLQHRFNNEIYR